MFVSIEFVNGDDVCILKGPFGIDNTTPLTFLALRLSEKMTRRPRMPTRTTAVPAAPLLVCPWSTSIPLGFPWRSNVPFGASIVKNLPARSWRKPTIDPTKPTSMSPSAIKIGMATRSGRYDILETC